MPPDETLPRYPIDSSTFTPDQTQYVLEDRYHDDWTGLQPGSRLTLTAPNMGPGLSRLSNVSSTVASTISTQSSVPGWPNMDAFSAAQDRNPYLRPEYHPAPDSFTSVQSLGHQSTGPHTDSDIYVPQLDIRMPPDSQSFLDHSNAWSPFTTSASGVESNANAIDYTGFNEALAYPSITHDDILANIPRTLSRVTSSSAIHTTNARTSIGTLLQTRHGLAYRDEPEGPVRPLESLRSEEHVLIIERLYQRLYRRRLS